MSELLLEILSGEIPSEMQIQAKKSYKTIFTKYFKSNQINFDQINVYIGPRRIVIHVSSLDTVLNAKDIELKGPKVTAPTSAIQGFCRANKIDSSKLTRKKINDVEFYFYTQKTKLKTVKDILLNTIQNPISDYVWPNSMYWGNYQIKWARPIDNILCIFEGKTLPFNYYHLTANNQSYGHRFMAPEAFKVSSFEEYKQKLADHFVVLDTNDRIEYIKDKLQKEADKLGLKIKNDTALLEEVAGLVEYPQILSGTIEKKFLSIPTEVSVNAMRTHQKYFSLFDKDGNFAPYFLFVSNIKSTDPDLVISDNEKVLSARLADALYFYNRDLETSLQEKSKKLNKVIFHAKLGTLKEKIIRNAKITRFIAPNNDHAEQAALLSKADIVSELVNEFPELQGVMGYYYAKHELLDDEIAIAIRDHYKPQGPSDYCSRGTAAIVALADKMDNLCGLMLAGEKATSSKDPFALRRQAIGIIRIILENNFNIELVKFVDFVCSQYNDIIDIKNDSIKAIIIFLEERLKYLLKDGYEIKLIKSLLNFSADSNLIRIQRKLHSINDFLSTQKGDDILNTYKRVSNMIEKKKIQGIIDPSLFLTDEEKKLFATVEKHEKKMQYYLNSEDYQKIYELLLDMQNSITNFFDNVMIQDKNKNIANNRILLLQKLKGIFNTVINFNEL